MEFMIGCNYWASHAGTNMWKIWNEKIVESDFALLSQYGCKYLRVFPIWNDFQPVIKICGYRGRLADYRMSDESLPTNQWYLNEVMVSRFKKMCKLAEKYDIKLIVGLITGWMSGRLFVPQILAEKNLYTDATALMLQNKFIKGFVHQLKGEKSIYAWDLGNECNCMSAANNREEAYVWTAFITNAIKAEDNTRKIISGMHGLTIDGEWRIEDQSENVDMMTTHPYPHWVPHCSIDAINGFRTLLHATAETSMYKDLSKKECLVEEIGTMGPMICDENEAANFLRVNLFSNWAHGASGLMWWCAFDQGHLEQIPYEWNHCEVELGLIGENYRPKQVVKEILNFKNLLNDKLPKDLPKAVIDGCIILSKDQDQWGIGYMAFLLAKKAGLTLEFCSYKDELPESMVYIMPSTQGDQIIDKSKFIDLMNKVKNGATLYVSMGEGFLYNFKEYFGAEIIDICNGKRRLSKVSCEVLETDENGNLQFIVNNYGNGKVYFLNFALEKTLLEKENAFDGNCHTYYEKIFNNNRISKNYNICYTRHSMDDKDIYVLINYSNKKQDLTLDTDNLLEVVYGDGQAIEAGDACVLFAKK